MNNNYTIEVVDGHHVVTILPKHEMADFKALGIAVSDFAEGIRRFGQAISKVGNDVRKRGETDEHARS